MPKITFIDTHGTATTVDAEPGRTLLEIAHHHHIPLEGACEGSLACSTCHVILEEAAYAALPPPSEDEEDMLDMAFGLTHTSRLGCQIVITRAHDGLVVRVPAETRNIKTTRRREP